MLNNADWSAFYLWKDGEIVAENAARCPLTMRVLQTIVPPEVQHTAPSVLFSLMRPGAHIPPHSGMVNTRLICHLPLIVPPGCEFRVGNETREWQEGKVWLFDDTIEHEAWNRSNEVRVILLFEVWRPELSRAERQLVQALFEGIHSITGIKPQSET
jgi:aspartate beta-hydroxylase